MEDAPDLKVDTLSDVPAENKPQSSPSNVATASKPPSTSDNTSPTTRSDDGSVTSPHPAQTQETYSTDLFRAFPKVCQKAKSGVQLCQAVSAFVTERAGLECSYAQSLLKLAQSAKAEDWSEQLTDCWVIVQEAMEHLAQERWAFASTMQTAIVPGAKAFAAQQEIQVQRLIAEGTKVRWAQQQMTTSMDKAREKYERKCQEAIEITTSMRKNSSDEVSSSKELTDKLAAGAGQLLTKMWDTTSAFGRNPLERQRSKLYSCLEEVIAAEKHYVQTVEYTNAQRLISERETKENLHAFQLTEEQRLEYLRDVLVRMQKAFVGMFSRSQQFVERMKESANSVDELADIEKGFQSLGSQEEIDVDRADLATNPFYLRITHIQAMSDKGQRMIEVINSVVSEFIASETRFSQSLRKLLRTHESGGLVPPSDLFGTSSSSVNTNFLTDEGATMANGWMTARDQVKLLLEVHQEFQSLLAEPVSLSLSTMKSEYEDVRVTTQENFSRVHLTLCNDSAAHRKLQQKLETKSRDFAVTFSYLPGATPVAATSYGIEVAQAMKSLSANFRLFNEKERRSEAKLRQLAEEIRLLQQRVIESSSALRQTYQIYVQVGKNSLQSLAKALEHMLQGGTSVGSKALGEFEKIDPRGEDEACTNEEEKVDSGMEQDEEFVEAQPLGVSDFQKKFKLDSPEQVVESFSCALYLSNFPFHGRLYLTRNQTRYFCFVKVASFSQISVMEKKNTALIVPNAIEFTVKGEKLFFTSFVFR
uniref:F-BAR domain-containing protein n=1 Tax=Phytophthora ramorum TaxID=164328 RepID=H3HBN7_PHYRM